MRLKIKKEVSMLIIFTVFAGVIGGANLGQTAALVGTKTEYAKLPAFLETGLDPNLLLLIDNSASMYDLAYTDPATLDADGNQVAGTGEACFANDFDPTVAYSGYFDPAEDVWYYHLGDMSTWDTNPIYENYGWYPYGVHTAPDYCASWSAYGNIYKSSDLCLMIGDEDGGAGPEDQVNLVFATGRYLNWLAASKFDVEKEILTGGKYDSVHSQLVMESRGCLEERFVKQTPVTKGGVSYFATFGIRPPDNAEQTADLAYNGSRSGTRIEVFKPTIAGFNSTLCEDAIDYWATPGANLGTLKSKTTACLEAAGASNITDSHVAFNHILQECWYYKTNGIFQPGAGTVASLKNDCEAVYGTLGTADYASPETLQASEVCAGQYSPDGGDPRWGYGFVGQCREPTYSSGSEMKDTVYIAGDPTTAATSKEDSLGRYYYYDVADGVYMECNVKPNPANGECKVKGADVWHERMVPNPADPPVISAIAWTDDDMGLAGSATADDTGAGLSQGYTCVDSALKSYCQELDDVTIVDPDVKDPQGTAWSIPAVLVAAASEAQLGKPMKTLKGWVRTTTTPIGLVQEFKYNMRLGAMEFNTGTVSECTPVLRADGTYRASLYDCLVDKGSYITAASVPDSGKRNGGRIISYLDDENDGHNSELVAALNAIEATAWTPTAEALYNAVGYYTQDNGGTTADATDDLRINGIYDFIWDHDATALGVVAWNAGTFYAAGAKVKFTHNWDHDGNGSIDETETKLYFTRSGGTSTTGAATIEEDKGVNWTSYDPVLAGCQSNNILVITDGASTADTNSTMTDFATTAGDGADGDNAVSPVFECLTSGGDHSLYASTLMDDLTYYASQNGNNIYRSTYQTVANLAKQPIKTYVVAAGTLEDSAATECNAKTQLSNAAANSGTTLLESTNPDQLRTNLRDVFEAIGGEVSSGSAASVISHSRSGDGAIYQAIFYPKQVDAALNEVDWTGDVHSLWLDAAGRIREDCGDAERLAAAVACPGPGDQKLDPSKDYIIEFYTDASGSARARRFIDVDGDGSYNSSEAACSNPSYTTEAACTTGGGTWNPDFVLGNILLKDLNYIWSAADWLAEANTSQRSYDSTVMARYIFTMIPDGSGVPVLVPFTTTALSSNLGGLYAAYFNAAGTTEADGIVNYIRGLDQGYRSRVIDWTADVGTETVKLGDIIHSTPTLVGAPAENYDIIYGDPTYREFRKQYQKRRSVVYAGGNDGGLHAFNGGYYNRADKEFLEAPDPALAQYDLGAELWMYVPRNVLPHLRWLTETNYGDDHNYYVDAKPYIFDAKIFNDDAIHPGGWGTVLVAGMRYGGGRITVPGLGTMRSSYFILDITDPEVPPVVLGEYTDAELGYTTGSATAIPMLRCDITTLTGTSDCTAAGWPMDWYLAFGSGPHSAAAGAAGPAAGMQGLSDQTGRVYVMKLGGSGTRVTDIAVPSLASVGTGQTIIGTSPSFGTPPSLVASFLPGQCSDTSKPNSSQCVAPAAWTTNLDDSFFGDFIAVDYDLDFRTESLYFGSVYDALSGSHDTHKGALHRLVANDNPDPTTWTLNMFYDAESPVTAAPSVATDGERAWIYFGTGRLFSAKEDKAIATTNPPTQFLGLKEHYGDTGLMDLYMANGGLLVNVTNVVVAEGGVLTPTPIPLTTGALDASINEFAELREKIAELDTDTTNDEKDVYHGWKIELGPGERVIGQPAILGDIVTFTSYIPSIDPCEPEGVSWLWAPYFRTGTAFYKSVVGKTAASGGDVLRKVSLGKGLATTPNIHTGAGDGTKAFVQSSTGAILSIEQTNPGVVKSGIRSWRELGGNRSCN